jgi:hypothetical protein
MKPSRQSLSCLVCLAGIVAWTAPALLASEPATAGTAPATMLVGTPFMLDHVTVDIYTNGDRELLKLEVSCHYLKFRDILNSEGKVFDCELVRVTSRVTILSSSDWQCSLDRHLGKVRRESKSYHLVPTVHVDGPLPDSLRGDILDIVKRRGFILDTETLRYRAPLPPEY